MVSGVFPPVRRISLPTSRVFATVSRIRLAFSRLCQPKLCSFRPVLSVGPPVLAWAVLCLLIFPNLALSQALPEGRTVALPDMEIYYETTGKGAPLLLLHGFAETGRMWDPFTQALAGKYQVIVPDLRGHGGSTNPGGQFTMRQSARDILALLDRLGIGRVKAIGASAGAMTLLHMATQQPDRVEAMVLVGGGTYYSAACREILGGVTLEGMSEAGWARLRRLHRRGDDQIRMLFSQMRSFKNSYDDVAFTPPLLSTIRARTLIVQGDRDVCFPPTMAVEMQVSIPGSRLWVIPNGEHWPIQKDRIPDFTQTVSDFLEGAWGSH
jgi:pimeloyl-ACP methyl ester carboxylesterase